MARSATNEIEGVGDGNYQRVYVPARLSIDSTYPFEAGDGVRLQLVEASCGREVLVLVSDALEVDVDETEIELQRSTKEVQTDLLEGST